MKTLNLKLSGLFLVLSICSSSLAQSEDLSRNNIWETLQHVSNVKTQGSRNTCTIFSTTALLESFYIRKFGDGDIDFSEQWMQYLISLVSETGGGNGSYVTRNFSQIKRHGLADERTFPYSTELWSVEKNSRDIEKYCEDLSGMNLKRCVSSHTHPGFLKASDEAIEKYAGGKNFVLARNSANRFKTDFIKNLSGSVIRSEGAIKRLLRKNITLTFEVDIFYGAWNTPHADKFDIPRETSLYSNGVVTYPELGSIDRNISPKHPARHAVQIIGYDDDVVVEYDVAMTDGSVQKFSRKGVYYFKNSWGTRNFGSKFKLKLNGKNRTIKGFGLITQDYAHDLGKFFSIDEKHYN